MKVPKVKIVRVSMDDQGRSWRCDVDIERYFSVHGVGRSPSEAMLHAAEHWCNEEGAGPSTASEMTERDRAEAYAEYRGHMRRLQENQ